MQLSRRERNNRGTIFRSAAWAASLLLGFPLVIGAQTINDQNTPPKPPRPPTIERIQYGPFEQNDLDLYIAKSDKPTPLVLHFFGGAWVVGNKNAVSPFLLDACAEAGITVASVNYRYSTQAIYPGPFLDGARALQFLRLHAKEYNLNPAAVASTGGSAGADISLWLGFHDDLADPTSDDPVKRQSTRISCVGAGAAQTVFDPRVVDSLLGKTGALSSAIPRLFGLTRDELESPRAIKLYEDAQAVSLLTRDDAPVFLFYAVANKPLTPETKIGDRVHHPAFGFYLKERMDKAGVECVLRLAEDYEGKGESAPVARNREMVRFFLKHFPKE
jgi:acetyl esterase/lipase